MARSAQVPAYIYTYIQWSIIMLLQINVILGAIVLWSHLVQRTSITVTCASHAYTLYDCEMDLNIIPINQGFIEHSTRNNYMK